MRYQEIKIIEEDHDLFEIKMSPKNLRAEAAKTGAMAGMEFEMIVPNAGGSDLDPEYERDEGPDRRARSFDDIEEFFNDGDYNSSRDVRNLIGELQEAYMEWKMDQTSDDWSEGGLDYLRDYIANNDLFDRDEALIAARDSVMDAFPDLDPNGEEFQKLISVALDKMEEQFAEDEFDSQGRIYNDAFEEFSEEKNEEYDEAEFLRETTPYMSDVESSFGIQWPYWYDINADQSGEPNIDMVADDFSTAIGRPVNASSRYHGATREKGKYVVEPDGSLSPDDPDDMGLEFVSPPLPLDELLSDLNKVKAWADQQGCYTGKANKTGLHINVSVPGYDLSKLDYVKLALLLGDEYVLQQFGRSAESYAKSSMGKVREIVRQNPDRAQALLDKMRGHMNQFASRAIASGSTDKFVSINTLDKNGYIEFRSPGGDWLNANFDKIENTLMRFTVAMAAAIDPDAYREEYQKKLYKLLTQDQDKNNMDTIKHFADYVAGKIPRAALRSFVKQAQLKRQIAKDPTGGQQYWWRVYKDGKGTRNGAMIEVVARTKAEAIDKAGAEWGLFSKEYRSAMDAEPIRPYDESPVKARVGEPQPVGQQSDLRLFDTHTYRAFDIRNNQTLGTFQAGEPGSDSVAEEFAAMLAREGISSQYTDYEVIGQQRRPPQSTAARPNRPNIGTQTDMENRLGWPDQTGDANYEIVDRRTMQPVFVFIANTEADAANKYQQWLAAAGYSSDPQELGWRRLETTQATPQQSSGEFTGNWLIQDPQGRTIHRFGGVGNVQSDANRAAITWLRAHPGSMQAGVTVVPEMR